MLSPRPVRLTTILSIQRGKDERASALRGRAGFRGSECEEELAVIGAVSLVEVRQARAANGTGPAVCRSDGHSRNQRG